MKRLLIAFAAVLFLAPAAVTAQTTITKTWFEGERITGIDASAHFAVTLVRSAQTRAVVEVSKELEPYVTISRDGDGVVRVGRRNLSNREQREYDQDRKNNRQQQVMRLTLYLPSINTIRLSGFTSLETSDTFTGEGLDVMVSGNSEIVGELNISSTRVKVQCSGFSTAESLTLETTTDLIVLVSGNSEVSIAAPRAEMSKFGVSGFSELSISGAGGKGVWTADGNSKLYAGEFVAKELDLNVSGFSNVRAVVNAAGADLIAKVSGNSEAAINASGVRSSRIETSGFSTVRIDGDGGRADWTVSGNSKLFAEGFVVKQLTLSTSGFSKTNSVVNAAGTDLMATVTGNSEAVINARGVGSSRIETASFATVRLDGDGDRGVWTSTGNSRIEAEGFTLKDLTVDASSFSSVRANVSGSLTTKTSGSATVRYRGTPARIISSNESVKPM